MHNFFNSAAALTPAVIASAVPVLPQPSNPEMYYAFIVLCGGVALLAGANQVMVFVKHFKEQPPPAQTYATKDEVKLIRREFLDELTKLESQFQSGQQLQENRASKIHGRIDLVLSAVQHISGVIEEHTRKT